MTVHLRARDIIDSETEAHYSFKTIWPKEDVSGRIAMTASHDHDFYELFLITHGQIWHIVNQSQLLLSAGHLVYIRPADCHGFRQFHDEDCGLINLAFPLETIDALFGYLDVQREIALLTSPVLPPMVYLSQQERQKTVASLQRLNSIDYTDKARLKTRLRVLLADLIGKHFVDTYQEIQVADNPYQMDDWLTLLCRRMEDPVNLRGGVQAMQALAHTSPEHLSRTVRKVLGCTPTQFVNGLRLTYAANLLLHTDQPILEISHTIGIDNLSYFYRIFKQRFGVTPARFRAQAHAPTIL